MNDFSFKLNGLTHVVLSIGFTCIASVALSQFNMVAKALDHYKNNEFDSAKYCIDEAAVHMETADSADTWYFRGFVYRALAKESKEQFPLSKQRAAEYFARCIKLDPSGANANQSKDVIQNIAISYYNDAVIGVKVKGEIDLAVKSFNYYMSTHLMAYPNYNFNEKMVQFYLAIGTFYLDQYKVDGKNAAAEANWNQAKAAFEKVLELDPDDFNGNYNIAILYYNKAVNIVNMAGYDITLARLSDIQDTSIVLFRRALPYMKTGLDVEPENEHILEGLAGIYFALNEPDKSKECKEKLKAITKKKEE